MATACVDSVGLPGAHGTVPRLSGGTDSVRLATPAEFAISVNWNSTEQVGTGKKSIDWLVSEHAGIEPNGMLGTHAFGGHGIEQPRHGQSVQNTTTAAPGTVETDMVRFSGVGKHSDVHDVEPEVEPFSV